MADKKIPSEPLNISSAAACRKGEGRPVVFNKQELGEILHYYRRMVAAGKWRDYALDHHHDRAVFSIFRHSRERFLFRIEKYPRSANSQEHYRIIMTNGHVLERGRDLRQVLRVFDRYLLRFV